MVTSAVLHTYLDQVKHSILKIKVLGQSKLKHIYPILLLFMATHNLLPFFRLLWLPSVVEHASPHLDLLGAAHELLHPDPLGPQDAALEDFLR
jgi:hypothetical protein